MIVLTTAIAFARAKIKPMEAPNSKMKGSQKYGTRN
jgi:hypothetical protein